MSPTKEPNTVRLFQEPGQVSDRESLAKNICKFIFMKEKLLAYIKSFQWKFLFLFAAFCIAIAVINNLRVSDDKSVEWFGTQEVLAKPE